jgi:ubiquinone/menaquinone biosynthesis C-methylase UbiE
MKHDNPSNKLTKYYDLIYSFKDYEQEAEKVINIINQFKKSSGNDLLDVACGTGKHLKYLKSQFNCMGTDISESMLEVARNNVSNIQFMQADMVYLKLNKRFDVITCLFSSIGYVKTEENLAKTLRSFSDHLKQGGIVIIEPWFTKDVYHVGFPYMTVYDSNEIKISRINVSKLQDDLSILDFHYLIAEKDSDVEYFTEHHELALFDKTTMLSLMKSHGFESCFIQNHTTSERGLYIGVKD